MTDKNLDWEQLDDHHCRLAVPGGWIFKAFEDVSHYSSDMGFANGWDWRVAVCFVPDPEHLWLSQ